MDFKGILGKGFIGLLGDFAAAFGGQTVARFLFGEKSRPEDAVLIKEAAQLAREGKLEEAHSMIEARVSGRGWADEQILLTDLLVLTFLTAEVDDVEERALAKIRDLANFLAGESNTSLTTRYRRRFRLAHIHEKVDRTRWENLIALARLPDDKSRLAFLKAAGELDKTFSDKIVNLVNGIDDAAGRRLDRIRSEGRPVRVRTQSTIKDPSIKELCKMVLKKARKRFALRKLLT